MITATDALNAVRYLAEAKALTLAGDDAGVVWADYLNYVFDELLPACRRTIRVWVSERRSWGVDVARLAEAVTAIRRERVAAVVQEHGIPDPDGLGGEPRVLNAWREAWRRAVEHGASNTMAQALAWRAVDRQPPPPAIEGPGPHGAERARAVLAALAEKARIP